VSDTCIHDAVVITRVVHGHASADIYVRCQDCERVGKTEFDVHTEMSAVDGLGAEREMNWAEPHPHVECAVCDAECCTLDPKPTACEEIDSNVRGLCSQCN
jgi:hypothetical protein